MAIHSTFLGSMQVTGDEAKAFSSKLSHARGTKAASESATSGRKLAASFAKNGFVTVQLRQPKDGKVQLKKTAKAK